MTKQSNGAEGSRTPVPKQSAQCLYECVCGLIVDRTDPRNGVCEPRHAKSRSAEACQPIGTSLIFDSGPLIQAWGDSLHSLIRLRERTACCWQL